MGRKYFGLSILVYISVLKTKSMRKIWTAYDVIFHNIAVASAIQNHIKKNFVNTNQLAKRDVSMISDISLWTFLNSLCYVCVGQITSSGNLGLELNNSIIFWNTFEIQ